MLKSSCGTLGGILIKALKKKQTIYFRTRGGSTHGWGNVHRIAHFAERCRSIGHEGIKIFAEGPKTVIKYFKSLEFETIELVENIQLKNESLVWSEFKKCEVLICEMLNITPERQTFLRGFTNKLVIFDDLLDHMYDADLVVSGQEVPKIGNLEISSARTKFLNGFRYFIFSREFEAAAEEKREVSNSLNSILVAFGGGEYDGAYIKVARAIASLNLGAEVTFVLGFAGNSYLYDEIAKELPRARIFGGVSNMAELISTADLCVVSAGYLKMEAALLGVPAVLISTQWHQLPIAEEFVNKTGALHLGYVSYVTSGQIASALTKMKDPKLRLSLSTQASSIVKPSGFDLVYKEIFQ